MKGTDSKFRPVAGTVCLVSGPNQDNADGYAYSEAIIYWRDDTFVLYGQPACWPVLDKWDHVLCKPGDAAEPGKPALAVHEIVAAYLKKHGYDGLCNDECGCFLPGIIPCLGDGIAGCTAGYRHKTPCCDCGHRCDDGECVVCEHPRMDSDEEVNAAYMHGFQNGKDAVLVPAPEPMTSVVRWVRYDGAPETLPEEGKTYISFRLFNHDDHPEYSLYTEGYGKVGGHRHGSSYWFDQGRRDAPNGEFYWTYLPQPPEGAE